MILKDFSEYLELARRSERGSNRTVMLLLLLFVLAVVVIGSQVLPIFYSNLELQNYIDAQATKASELPDSEIRYNIKQLIEKLEIPVDDIEEDLKINRGAGEITIEVSYSEVVYVDFGEDRVYDLWTFDFNPSTSFYYE